MENVIEISPLKKKLKNRTRVHFGDRPMETHTIGIPPQVWERAEQVAKDHPIVNTRNGLLAYLLTEALCPELLPKQ